MEMKAMFLDAIFNEKRSEMRSRKIYSIKLQNSSIQLKKLFTILNEVIL